MQAIQKYQDVKVFLIAIAFISAFNYYLTYTNIKLNSFLVITYINDTVQGWLAWWAMRSIIIRLDRKMPYTDKPLKRILVQILLTTIAGLAIIIILTELSSLIVKGRFAPTNFYLFDVFIFIIWMLVINGIYIGMHYYYAWKQSEMQRQEEKKVRLGGFSVRQGKESRLIPFSDILSFYTEGGNTILLTLQGKKFFLDKSLDKIEDSLPADFFFRLNRQYILHRRAMTGFKRTGDGKIDVSVAPFENFPQAIQVSRTRAARFKNWFQPAENEK